MGESISKTRSKVLLFATGFYVVVGIFLLILSLGSNLSLWPLTFLGIFTILAGVGLFMLKRWGFWIAIFVFPLIAGVAISTLSFSVSYPTTETSTISTLFDISLAILFILSIVAVIIVLNSRGSLKNSNKPSETESKSS